MKKTIILMLVALMLLTATSCGKKTETSTDETAEITAEPSIDEPAKESEEQPGTAIEAHPTNPIKAKLTRGKQEGNVYTSDYAGLAFTKPDIWSFSTDEELAKLLNMEAAMLAEDKLAHTLAETTMVYDMIATDPANGNNVSVSYENMVLICGKAVDVSEYTEILKNRISDQMQVDFEFTGEETVSLSSNEYHRVIVSIKSDLFEMQQAYYVRIIDDVAVCITTTLIGDATVADIEAMFT